MNWNEIQKKYPKAFELFIKTYCLDYSNYTVYFVVNGVAISYNSRNLYDFFDKQGIFGDVQTYAFGEKDIRFEISICENKPEWKFFKDGNGSIVYFATRTEAEDILFKGMFEILESKLQ